MTKKAHILKEKRHIGKKLQKKSWKKVIDRTNRSGNPYLPMIRLQPVTARIRDAADKRQILASLRSAKASLFICSSLRAVLIVRLCTLWSRSHFSCRIRIFAPTQQPPVLYADFTSPHLWFVIRPLFSCKTTAPCRAHRAERYRHMGRDTLGFRDFSSLRRHDLRSTAHISLPLSSHNRLRLYFGAKIKDDTNVFYFVCVKVTAMSDTPFIDILRLHFPDRQVSLSRKRRHFSKCIVGTSRRLRIVRRLQVKIPH